MKRMEDYQRASMALQTITRLTTEKQALMNRFYQVSLYERRQIQGRLQELEVALAHAHEERRRARAGAPPAPETYDPLGALPRSEHVAADSHRARSWKHKIAAIKADYQAGDGLEKQALAEKYNLSLQQIGRVLGEESARAHPTAKLNETQVRDILQRYRASNGRRGIIKELSDVFQVRKSTICDIIARRTWRSIDIDAPGPEEPATASRFRESGSLGLQAEP